MKQWIKNLAENFIVAEIDNRIIGFLFFEYYDMMKEIPFAHLLEHKRNGQSVYISDIGISDEFQNSDILQRLFDKLFEKSEKDGCKKVVWLTGERCKHDKIELKVLLKNNFIRKKRVKNWEAHPGYFVEDHYIWTREIKLTG